MEKRLGVIDGTRVWAETRLSSIEIGLDEEAQVTAAGE